jgi:hypothetical protein
MGTSAPIKTVTKEPIPGTFKPDFLPIPMPEIRRPVRVPVKV